MDLGRCTVAPAESPLAAVLGDSRRSHGSTWRADPARSDGLGSLAEAEFVMTEEAATERPRLERYLAAYRNLLSWAEAARRAGVPAACWREVETGSDAAHPAESGAVSPRTVATMCAAVGADIATGFKLAGSDPGSTSTCSPPHRSSWTRGWPWRPHIAVHRAIIDAVSPASHLDPRPRIAPTTKPGVAPARSSRASSVVGRVAPLACAS
jgi:hypothetical protein